MTERFSAPPDREGLRFLTIAEIGACDFHGARQYSGFARWVDYREFCVERECLALGYELAGVRAPRQLVPFAAFEEWSRLTGAPLNLDGLDEFAAHWRYRLGRPLAPSRGLFGAPGKPAFHAVEIDGMQNIVVRKAVYLRWREEFMVRAPFPPPDLSVYATQVVASCLPFSSLARRSAPKMA